MVLSHSCVAVLVNETIAEISVEFQITVGLMVLKHFHIYHKPVDFCGKEDCCLSSSLLKRINLAVFILFSRDKKKKTPVFCILPVFNHCQKLRKV